MEIYGCGMELRGYGYLELLSWILVHNMEQWELHTPTSSLDPDMDLPLGKMEISSGCLVELCGLEVFVDIHISITVMSSLCRGFMELVME